MEFLNETTALPGVAEALPEPAAEDKDLTCPICRQLLNDTFLTTCGHSFCYMCISTHLQNKSECPCCAQFLTTSQLIPNFLLDKLLKEESGRQQSTTASPVERFRRSLEQGCKVSVKELDRLLSLVSERKRKMKEDAEDENLKVLSNFLSCVNKQKSDALNEVQNDLLCIEEDVSAVEKRILALHRARERLPPLLELVSDDPTGHRSHTSMDMNVSSLVGTQSIDASFTGPISQDTNQSASGVLQRKRIHYQFNELQESYLKMRRPLISHSENHETKDKAIIRREGYSPGLDDFQSVLSTFTRYSRLRVIAEFRHEDIIRRANFVSSIEFDCDDELFATAGVSRRIKVFDFASVVNEPTDVRPVVEIATRSKLSCLSWNKFTKYHMASSDYEGILTIWDVNTQQSILEYEEHEKRAWSIDFSVTEPSMLVSGSDDGTVKVWCMNEEASVLNIDMRANVCSVKYNPDSSNFIAVGSADKHVYYYDLRNPRHPLYVLSGHKKTVSYVRYLSNHELASASTDSTLQLWDVKRNFHIQSFTGHTNENYFVGLTASNEFLACGSEANSVVVYHKAISKPVMRHQFGYPGLDDEEEDARSYFVSAVCWKSDSHTMLAANSKGTIKALVLAP